MLIPLSDDNSMRRSVPVVTFLIILINALFWITQLNLGEHFTNAYSTVPYEIVNNVDLAGTFNIDFGGQIEKIKLYTARSLNFRFSEI